MTKPEGHGPGIAWPVKTREFLNHHFDSTIWNDFAFRDDDVIISTYAKSGTTWLQQIVSQLIFQGQEGLPVAEMSPWVDFRVPPKDAKLAEIERQDHRRFLKTHLPVDALVYSPKAKYIFSARDGRDVLWSLYNHHSTAKAEWYDVVNDTPGRVGPPIGKPEGTVVEYFRTWLEQDGAPFWPFWPHIRSWWEIRGLPNLLLVHFTELKADLPGQIERIAAFLDIPVTEDRWPVIIDHCGFDYMRRNGAHTVPAGGFFWEGGPRSFLHRGRNGRWRDVLPEADNAAYEARALAELGQDCARWLAEGRIS